VELPTEFRDRIRRSYPNGAEWLGQLPALVHHAVQRWGLSDVRPVPNLSYNFVAFAHRGAEEVVLKAGPPNNELASELAALRLFDGQGCCRLLEAEDADYAFLLERLRPGKMLAELPDDAQATAIAAEVMLGLWREPSSPSDSPSAPIENGGSRRGGFIQLSDWFAGLDELRPRFGGGTGPFPRALVERVEIILPELFADPRPPVLMHGDFHHFNVLSSGRGWLVIDPKGVIGPRGYECGPLLINPWDAFGRGADPVGVTERRIAILSERLGMSQETILGWGICHALLSAWWDLSEGAGEDYSIRCGEAFLQVRTRGPGA
jgi:streptomycin 6-kinase